MILSSKNSVANQKKNMNQSDYSYSSLPNDVALKIASSLEVPDLSSLGCCSRVWRELCGLDCLWESLFKERWPLLYEAVLKDANPKGWRGFYIKQHKQMKDKAEPVIKFVEQQCSRSESLKIKDYSKAIEWLTSMQFGFKDVQILLFKPKLNVSLNLVGLHYCLSILQVPASNVMEALEGSKISDRRVCVEWWKRDRWFYGFRLQDESQSRCLALEDLATAKDEEVLGVLERGAIHEVLRVQISIADSSSNPSSSQSS